ncbi:MAG: TVP38/TMEM64 family protein [Pirellulaceae bacterium]|nr:TVP38/TMEM64 family protein [Planctomycetaceae bacterium]MDG1807346.1 TVP38/TMEM64 family protein [Pirellulaceae bacterium]MDG2102634.1 TVP38/TMEM64 family protein [Pirellulaceae bacterium]
MHEPPPKTETPKLPGWIRWGVLGLVVSVAVVLYMQFSDALSLENLAQQEAQLRDFQSRSPWLVYAVSLLIYITITGLSLPGAAPLTMLFGWYFGVLQGVLLVSFASTTGATLAFLLSRFLFRNSVQNRFGDRLDAFNRALEREGPFYLFSLRLIPAVPFFVINAVMGLTPIRVWTFWWVSQLGMLAGTLVYVYAGSTVPDLATLADQGINAVFSARQLTQILVAFVLLGLFPLISRWIIKRVIGKRAKPPETKSS